ncbi:MAG: hypothetical protein FWF99_04715 [Desulfovibrionaceae bacterium]|nr:hypothetical protein [Desulfovibrionaceae bacterium]
MLEYYRFKVISNLFTKGQIEAASMQLGELQKRYVALCEENAVLKANVREYEDVLFMERNFVFDGNCYWLITGNIRQGPFCPNCYNRYGQMTRLAGLRLPVCPVCGSTFEKTGAEMPQARALEQSAAVRSLRVMSASRAGGDPGAGEAEERREQGAGGAGKGRRKAVLLPFAP